MLAKLKWNKPKPCDEGGGIDASCLYGYSSLLPSQGPLAEHEVVAVVTQPDRRKAGTSTPTPCEGRGSQHGLTILQPERIEPEVMAELKSYAADLFVVVVWPKIPMTLLHRAGCINVDSLLPKYRGSTH